MPDPAAAPAQSPDSSPAPRPAASWTATVSDCPDVEVTAAQLWLAGAVAVEVRGPTLVAHFTDRVDPAAVDLARSLPTEGQRSPTISWSRLPAVDHMAAWRAASTPVRAGRFDLVPAHLADDHVTPAGLHRILVDAGMAFGSGHHDTTAGCLEALSAIDVRGHRILDVGTGTGVLAIAAARSGAVDVVGVDTDPQAIQVARANVATNQVEVALAVGSTEVVTGPFDGILANLLTNLVVDLAPDLAALLAPGGWLVTSGIGIPRAPAVVAALSAAGFRSIETRHRGDWAVLAAVCGPDRGREGP